MSKAKIKVIFRFGVVEVEKDPEVKEMMKDLNLDGFVSEIESTINDVIGTTEDNKKK
ncbi:hypothetical protein [Mesobacillus zeae]|uniref:hypothetical protein n=1 Tax=Mesobacillus zeae TaxID=1917180 RepID=UPI0015E7CA80|nr:hypothetical protein [Mesobacillus zeae]